MHEVLIPHLEATMGLNWSSPPPDVARLLEEGGARKLLAGTGPSDLQLDPLIRRCGSRAVAAVLARVGMAGAVTSSLTPTLAWSDVVEVQTVLLGREARFRRGDAITPARSERYAILVGLESLVARKVEADAKDGAHDILKGIRLYLDFAFVHPFEDGNARAALLWLAYFHWRCGWRLPRLARLPAFEFIPGDKACYWDFARLALRP